MLTTDRLVTSHLLLEEAGEYLEPREDYVAAAMDPMWRMDHDNPQAVHSGFLAMLRTAEIFVLDRDSRAKVWHSFPPPSGIELPPLPYRRIIIEIAHNDQAAPYLYWNAELQEVTNGDVAIPDNITRTGASQELNIASPGFHGVYCIALHELVQGELWDVFLPFRDTAGRHVWAYRIGPYGVVEPQMFEGADPDRRKVFSDWVLSHAVNNAHIITARGVAHAPLRIGRKQQRRYERAFKRRMPSIYYLDLACASEETKPGSGLREYTVRWMVRGHWRHTPNGSKLCTHIDCNPRRPATWIHSHIKGPMGAPWKEQISFKGKPVYMQRTEDTNAA